MATANYTDMSQETVLFNDAELMTPLDFNEMQRLAERRHMDYALRPLLLDGYDPGTHPQARPIAGSFSIRQSAVLAMSCRVYPGTLLFRAAADPGQPDPGWMMHRMASELTVAVDAAHATLDRIDLLSYKVEYDAVDTGSVDADPRVTKTIGGTYTSQTLDKRRRTKLTITYTPGTPNAVPVAPATPAGHVAFARIYIDPAITTILTGYIGDFREPAGSTICRRKAGDGYHNGNGALTPSLFDFGTSPEYFEIQVSPTEARAVDSPDAVVHAADVAVAHQRLKRLTIRCKIDTGVATFFALADLGGSNTIQDLISGFVTSGVFGTYQIAPSKPIWSMGGNGSPNIGPNPTKRTFRVYQNPWQAVDHDDTSADGVAGGSVALIIISNDNTDLFSFSTSEWWGF